MPAFHATFRTEVHVIGTCFVDHIVVVHAIRVPGNGLTLNADHLEFILRIESKLAHVLIRNCRINRKFVRLVSSPVVHRTDYIVINCRRRRYFTTSSIVRYREGSNTCLTVCSSTRVAYREGSGLYILERNSYTGLSLIKNTRVLRSISQGNRTDRVPLNSR